MGLGSLGRRMRQGISVEEALECILASASPLAGETVLLLDALGRSLTSGVVAGRRLPPLDSSAMDGYAVRLDDLAGATEAAPVELSVAFEAAAGHAATNSLEPGEVARIFTGAAVPVGSQAVVRQEDTEAKGDCVRIRVCPQLGENIRSAGEDIDLGQTALEAGCAIGPAEVGVLASLGRSRVEVRRRPRVAILSGGDELVEVDGDVSGGKIVASNAYTLTAACRLLGAEPSYLGIADDHPESVEQQFRAALAADCIVSTAGVSVGDHDYVRPVLEKLGCQLDFWGVRMKPGYPLAFGRFDPSPGAEHRAPLVFGLPGNPVSATVCFEQFVRPALLKMMGRKDLFRPVVEARIAETLRKKPGRLHFVRVTLTRRGGEWVAQSTGNQSSGVMTSMARADGLLIFAEEASELKSGERAPVQVLDEGLFSGTQLGF
ncbi:MAG: molybdopterin molybdotransferase MoeA [Myxococcota bacterium]|nr:molybdopterin molybdotransferase MoeA [Myxococcota bacterium]